MSVFCAHCRKRLILENYIIKSYQAVKGYATCGDVSVEKRGRVAAPIQSNSLTVKGKVHGKVEAQGKVEVTSTGTLEGSLRATSLLVVKGASFEGYCEIRPATVDAQEPKLAETTSQAQTSRRANTTNGVKKISTIGVASTRTKSAVKKISTTIENPNPKPTEKKTAPKKNVAKKITTKKVATRAKSKSSNDDSSSSGKSKPVKAISTRRKSTATSK